MSYMYVCLWPTVSMLRFISFLIIETLRLKKWVCFDSRGKVQNSKFHSSIGPGVT